jgi:hypothetical protein
VIAETEPALEFADTVAVPMPSSLQGVQGHQATGDKTPLRPCRARWTSRRAEVILIAPDQVFELRAQAMTRRTSAAGSVRRLVVSY